MLINNLINEDDIYYNFNFLEKSFSLLGKLKKISVSYNKNKENNSYKFKIANDIEIYLKLEYEKKLSKKNENKLRSIFELCCDYIVCNIKINTDDLTGLFNKKRFYEYIIDLFNRNISDVSLENTNNCISIIIFDIDHFKRFNDKFGHLIGDKVLKLTGYLLKKICKAFGAKAFRFGGEEFITVLAGADHKTSLEFAEIVRKEIKNLDINDISSKRKIDYPQINISGGFDVGFCGQYKGISGANKFLNNADIALNSAKKNGRDQIFYYRDILNNNDVIAKKEEFKTYNLIIEPFDINAIIEQQGNIELNKILNIIKFQCKEVFDSRNIEEARQRIIINDEKEILEEKFEIVYKNCFDKGIKIIAGIGAGSEKNTIKARKALFFSRNKLEKIGIYSIKVLMYTAHCNYMQGKLNEAYNDYIEALKFDKNDPDIYNNIAMLEITLGDTKKSLKYFNKAIELYKVQKNSKYFQNLHLCYINISLLYFQSSNIDKAIEYSEKAYDLNKDNPKNNNNLAYFLYINNKNLEKALNLSNKACKLENSKTLKAYYLDTNACILKKLGKIKEAKLSYNKALRIIGNSSMLTKELKDL